jgi:hypothetical protein
VTQSGDGHQLQFTNPALGEGYWDFTNGNKEVRFQNIEEFFEV